MIKKLFAACIALGFFLGAAGANTGGAPWDKFPTDRVADVTALQHGAKLFVNYCLNCHSASYMRYNRMRDLGLTEEQIKQNLMFASEKVGDTMKVSMDPKLARAWFGNAPPDLSVIARSRAGSQGSGADYLYTYLRGYYRDDTKATGWNNIAFPAVAMPHVLWQLQGQQKAIYEEVADPHEAGKTEHVFKGFELTVPGELSTTEYNSAIADLVAYLVWMGEPAQNQRVRLGVWVLIFLACFTVIAWRLNAVFWKDIK
jgi:ubiquinol-cytochrome c reductase cytochrome c1 subunit